MSFNKNLKEELLFQNLQFKEFAGKLDIPYNTFMGYIDIRQRLPRVDLAYKMAELLNVTVEYLMTGEQVDNYKKFLTKSDKELLALPSIYVNQIQSLIHSFYELYKQNK